MNKLPSTGIMRIIKASLYSWKGLKIAWKAEAAFRQEIGLCIIAVIIALCLEMTSIERLLLIGSVILIVIVELLNSALEAIVDRIGHEYHELSANAKDMGSAAVFISLLLAAIVWITILFL